jgi:Carbohydrate-selective porin, OprB family
VSGVEAPPAVRLFNLWIEQKFGSDVNLRFGKFTAAQEFLVSENADLFVSATLGWPLLASEDLPNGGPNFRSPCPASGRHGHQPINSPCAPLSSTATPLRLAPATRCRAIRTGSVSAYAMRCC